jgi:hypothetical protein
VIRLSAFQTGKVSATALMSTTPTWASTSSISLGDAQQALTKDAAMLKQIFQGSPGFTVMIEVNCDERGSGIYYSLGLGDRRATST